MKQKKKKVLNEVTEANNKLKLAELNLQLEQNSINHFEKIEFCTKSKPVAENQLSSVPANSKPPIVSLKTTTENNIDDFPYTSPKFKTVISITNQNKQPSFIPDSNNISNPDIETINQTPCLSLASENKSETSKIVAIEAFIDESIGGKETVVATDSEADDSIRIIFQKDIELAVYQLLMLLDLTVILASGQNSSIHLKPEFT